ncbi:ciliogenesis-associated TTC17-interacting protein [Perognathus longimembris pacificus]|uniref:ciliogenesis-associated TTC17-interacting protein n=1 Tax=Perognathus longimembris pacificus TaxID=214514 RepID=UPI002018862A|nr:ciliogenesis-associated TTC17-interacting protein [Perognathus longimembris pacificus]
MVEPPLRHPWRLKFTAQVGKGLLSQKGLGSIFFLKRRKGVEGGGGRLGTSCPFLAFPFSITPKAKDQQQTPSPVEVTPLPEANADAINFLRSLSLEELQMLFFSETLTIISDTGEPQGEMTIEVQRGKYKDELGIMSHCVFVHAFSRGFLDKTLSGNSLLGYISETLEIMEQHSQEFIKLLILPMERKISLLKQDEQMVMRRSIKEGEEVKTGTSSFPWNAMEGFISEAANLVLLRVMAWRQTVPNQARFLALDSDGKLCHCTYEALGFQTMQVGRQQAEVFIIEQMVHSVEGIPMACQFYLLSDGHLAKRVQVGSPGCCIISKIPVLREKDEIEPPPQFEKKPLVWEEDQELFSRFQERKEELRLSHTRYLCQHPEAHALIADFLLFLLLRQPQDVVTFAAEHFGPFAWDRPPSPGLRSSHRPSPFRSLDDVHDSEEDSPAP